MSNTIAKGLMAVGAVGALALGGSALAGAAGQKTTTTQGSTAAQGYGPQGQPPSGSAPDPSKGGHVGRNGQREVLLTGDTAAKVKAAALAKVPGATVERVETDADHGSPYEAHLRKSDGTELEVLVDKSFAVTAVNTMQSPLRPERSWRRARPCRARHASSLVGQRLEDVELGRPARRQHRGAHAGHAGEDEQR